MDNTNISTQEIWKTLKGYEGFYEVSNLGRVKSVERLIDWNGTKRKEKEKVRKGYLDDNGYLRIGLNKNGERKHKRIHQLIAECFINRPKGNYIVDHIDRDKLNNSIQNLRYVTPRDNTLNKSNNRGLKGVVYMEHCGTKKWNAKIRVGDKRISLGYYKTEIEGHCVYLLALDILKKFEDQNNDEKIEKLNNMKGKAQMGRIRRLIKGKQYSFKPSVAPEDQTPENASLRLGRPTRKDEAALSSIIFRVTAVEREEIEIRARDEGVSISQYCRSKALNRVNRQENRQDD